MTFWRVASKARSTRVAIEGSYRGASAFLIGGSPRILELDLRMMKMPGVWSMAINNAAVVFEPNAFISLDVANCFNFNIFSNPRIIKFLNYSRWDNVVSGKKLCSYPNTLFFDLQDETQMYMSEFCRFDGPLPYWKNTFFTALACLYQLGFINVYLVGCAFDAGGEAYAHESRIRESDKSANQEVYEEAVEKLRTLLPMVRDEGLSVYTCHQKTALSEICPYVDYYSAVSKVVTECTQIDFNDYKHSIQES